MFETTTWNINMRLVAAMFAMNGILAARVEDTSDADVVAKRSFELADALIKAENEAMKGGA